MGRPTAAYVDLAALKQNIQSIAAGSKAAHLMAMVKADAYGHGILPCAKAAQEAGADYFGVATVEEGEQLRKAGIAGNILCVGAPQFTSLKNAVENDVILTVYDCEPLEQLDQAACRSGKTARVHIKLETGMNRLGVQSEQALSELLAALKTYRHIRLEGAFTHFAASDSADLAFTREQAAAFERRCAFIKRSGWPGLLMHAGSSAVALTLPEYHYDMIRPGIAMYGYYPSAETAAACRIRLQPVLRWETRLTQVKTIHAGEPVGYGRTFTAPREMRIGIVPAGYGDGYKRILSNRGYVLIGGSCAPIVGRVCMDQFMIDVTDIPSASSGALVTLIGQQGDVSIWADKMAELAETIPYEITLGITVRVPKHYCGA